jgi:cation diffusion facilitator family transporter
MEDNMDHLKKKNIAAALSVASNVILIIIKIIVGILSGSVSVISEAIHSLMDLSASFIALFSVNMSSKPADEGHPYGHGKIENVSGVIEGILIFVAVILIIKESVEKIMHPSEMDMAFLAIGVMAVSAIINFIVAKFIYRTVKTVESVALEADALHHLTDTYTSLGVMAGLVLIKVTGIAILDPLVAIGVALFITKEAWIITKTAFSPLLDHCISEEDQEEIYNMLEAFKHKNEIVGYKKIKTRKSGHLKCIDIILIVSDDISIISAHEISDRIEIEIEEILHNTVISIHIEPERSQSTPIDECNALQQ